MSHSPISPAQTDEAYSSGWDQMLRQIRSGGSWSGRERNCCFLNTGGPEFADVSAAAGLDFLDDARAVVPVDWDGDGDLDLWFSNRTGPRLRFLRNTSGGSNHYLAVRLEGTQCNRDAIGARAELSVNDGAVIKKTVRAEDGYLSQSSRWIHFGLAGHDEVRGLRVSWPGGQTEQFTGLRVDGHFDLVQGTGVAVRREMRSGERELEAITPAVRPPAAPTRIVLHDRVPLPRLAYRDLGGEESTVNTAANGPALINLWATWCVPCLEELKDLSQRHEQFQKLGLAILALSVDGLEQGAPAPETAREFLDRLRFRHDSGMATPELLDKLEVLQQVLLSPPREPGQLPASYLLDGLGRLAVIYLGPVNADQLIADIGMLDGESPEDRGFPFPGRWYQRPYGTTGVLTRIATLFAQRGDRDESLRFAGLAADMAARDRVSAEIKRELGEIFFDAGTASFRQHQPESARLYYRQALALVPQWAEAHANMGSTYSALGDPKRALEHYEQALALNPDLPQALHNLGAIHLQQGHLDQAEAAFRSLLEIAPDSPVAHNALGLTYLRKGNRTAAVAAFRRAVELDPDFVDAKRNLASVPAERAP